jgi:hypothetical protein
MVFLRKLMESRPYFRRIPDQKMFRVDGGSGGQHIQATRDQDGRYAFVYFPQSDQEAHLELSAMTTRKLRAWWYDPRTGVGTLEGVHEREVFRSPSHGPDWVLVLDDPAAGFLPPGIV